MPHDFPLITIGMTCFNADDTIARAIESALKQDYPNTEIVIVDDGSKDKSREIIADYASQNPKINYIPHEQNTGFAGALNTIIKEAKGEFIAIFDDDDVSLPERLSRQYERITEYEKEFSTDLVLCHVARIQHYENGFTRYEKTLGTESGIAPNGAAVAKRVLYGDLGEYGTNIVGSCANCARMARTQIYRDMNGYDDSIRRGEDTDFSIRFALKGGHFPGIEEPLVHQTMTKGDEKTLDKEYDVEKAFTHKHADFLQQAGWYQFALRWLEIRYANYRKQRGKLALLLIKLFIVSPFKTIKKILWALPARNTRKAFKQWHTGELDAT